ncbi:class I SAM-dependent methyltransferase [Alteribacter natronophilus]|uniref:class I SAM-dependent methyltransferase n=1 Tax=Alteribacter natronophilus TaxID=2583810 RepID=UPI001487013C|nr:SAM-dependent methyltransferase [Alteribacter natronophilus]
MEAIRSLIRNSSDNAISFARFMEKALYDETGGYYTKPRVKVGSRGDFYTSPHVHPVFAWTFGRFFAGVIRTESLRPAVCEWGAGDGAFASGVLDYMKKHEPDLYREMSYTVIEQSPHHRELLNRNLSGHINKVYIFSDPEECRKQFPGLEGIVFSNELLDAFPVHVVENIGGVIHESFVTEGSEGQFEEVKKPCVNGEILDWLKTYGPELPEGHRTEIAPEVKDWISSVCDWLARGVTVTVDYGYTGEELVSPELRHGSLRGYREHRMVTDPLAFPGGMDLTSHVHWDTVCRLFKDNDMNLEINEKQGRFLTKAGILSFVEQTDGAGNPFSGAIRQNRAVASLTAPAGTARAFSVNVHSKNLTGQKSWPYFKEDPYSLKKDKSMTE